jgi:predicted dehydrogenase
LVSVRYDNGDCARYRDWRELMERKDIDAVVVSTPDHNHAVVTMAAIKAGRAVYCEKPLTHSIYEARRIAQAAKDAGVATQMGNQGNSGEGIRLICEWIWDGAIGSIREVHCWTNRPAGWWAQGIDRPQDTPEIPKELDWDLWLGPAPYRPYHPAYVPFKWRGWWDFGTGALGDMGCHIMEAPFMSLKLGSPVSIEGTCTPVNSQTAPLGSIIHYNFAARGDMPAVRLSWYDGGLEPARPAELEHGIEPGDENGGVLFIGDKGSLMCGCYSENPRLIPLSRMKEYKQPPKTIERSKGHRQDWLDACRGGRPAGSGFDYAAALTETVLLGNLAIREDTAGKKLEWDSRNMQIANLPEANKYIRRDYRQPWTL